MAPEISETEVLLPIDPSKPPRCAPELIIAVDETATGCVVRKDSSALLTARREGVEMHEIYESASTTSRVTRDYPFLSADPPIPHPPFDVGSGTHISSR